MRSFSLWLVAVLLLGLLSACAPTRYPQSYKGERSVAHTPVAPELGQGGYVKRGKPYQIFGKWYHPLASGEHYDETGMASWYGNKFHGKKTANGETYDMYAMTAAHTTLPMPSMVLVTNLENGKQVRVRVNDRGPFVKKRLIDLSYAAAKALDYTNQGTTRIRVQTLRSFTPVAKQYAVKKAYIQVGAFQARSTAERTVASLKQHLHATYPPLRVMSAVKVYRVRLGPFANDAAIKKALQHVKKSGFPSAIIVHD